MLMRILDKCRVSRGGLTVVLVAIFLCAGMMFGGCRTLSRFVAPPGRTLAPWIKRVYVPMFKNQSGDYGLQMQLTNAVTDAFLRDGRLEVAKNARADVRVEGTILSFEKTPLSMQSDSIPLITRYAMKCIVRLYDPYATDRSVPFASYTVTANTEFIGDTRRLVAITASEAYSELCEQMGANIVETILSGRSDPPTAAEAKAKQEILAKKNPNAFEPDMNEPKLPRFTPREDRR